MGDMMGELRSVVRRERKIGFYLKSAWYFDKTVEKIILVVLVVLGVWKLFGLIGGLF